MLNIKYSGTTNTNTEIVKEKWNSWIFELSTQTWSRGESSYSNFNLWSNINAERITPNWKFVLKTRNNFSKSSFVIDDLNTYTSTNQSYSTSVLVVKSINPHWSLGGKIKTGSSSYSNFNFYTEFFPAIEYNIFPYSESSVKQFTVRFESGHEYANYTDTTIYDKKTEHLFAGKLSSAYKVNKKWGNINTSISSKTYLHDPSKYNISIRTSLNIRIVKGLSVRLSGGGSFIRNQINLKKENASYEEILLRQQQISTDYSYWLSAGLSYTFGSIYNNIVNPRFDN